jgi:hypothetical protein
MFGLSNELCGENGFGWSRRLMLVHGAVTDPSAAEEASKGMLAFGSKYGYSAKAAEAAPANIAQIVGTLAGRLESQRSRGSRFFIGDQLSALDIYWAAFAALIEPLPENLCPMPPDFRRRYICDDSTYARRRLRNSSHIATLFTTSISSCQLICSFTSNASPQVRSRATGQYCQARLGRFTAQSATATGRTDNIGWLMIYWRMMKSRRWVSHLSLSGASFSLLGPALHLCAALVGHRGIQISAARMLFPKLLQT